MRQWEHTAHICLVWESAAKQIKVKYYWILRSYHTEQKFDSMFLLTSDQKTKHTSRQILMVPNVINQPIHDLRRSRYTQGINSDPPSHKHNEYKWSSFISLSDQSRHNKTIRRATVSYGLMVGNWVDLSSVWSWSQRISFHRLQSIIFYFLQGKTNIAQA